MKASISQNRLVSLDVFRGLTIAGMILVNNPGNWSTVYPPLLHADWHGCTPTDLVFPFFLFIVGVSISFSLAKRKAQDEHLGPIYRKVLRRTLLIFGWGLLLASFPYFGFKARYPDWTAVHYLHFFLLGSALLVIVYRESLPQAAVSRKLFLYIFLSIAGAMCILGFFLYDFSSLRIPGVLQRIALVYGIVAVLFLRLNAQQLLICGIGLLLLYWALMTLVPVPGGLSPNLEPETNLGAWLDRLLLSGHLWSQSRTWDPEGLLSTLPAIVTGISGVLTGLWLKTPKGNFEKVSGLLVAGTLLVAVGLIWDLSFPINKKIWTSSYVVYTSGIALLFLGVIYWLVDIHAYRKWAWPFVVYGMNALFVYILSGMLAKLMYYIRWEGSGGELITLQGWIYEHGYLAIFSDYNASLAYAITNVLVLWLVAWWLYHKHIFIKV